jgi:lysozyme
MTSPVIDLSHWNPTPDWAAIRKAGVVGVIHKATESTNYVDDKLFERARAALDSGLKWSTYHFMRPSPSITDQIAFYLKTIDPVEGERICLDHEDAGVSLDDLETCVEFVRTERPDLQVAIYSGHVIKEQLNGNRSEILAGTSLWIAQYTSDSTPVWPTATWRTWSLWQWTDKETIPGISAPVDGDRWNGDKASLLAWFGPVTEVTPEPVPPEPEPAFEHVDIAINTTPGARVSITINGETILAASLEASS